MKRPGAGSETAMRPAGASARDSVRVEYDRLELWVAGHLSASESADRAARLHVVALENALYQGEERFLVVEFPDSVWVVPGSTPGIDALGARLHACLGPRRGVVRSTMPTVPFAWRRRVGGFLPLFPIPRLARHVGHFAGSWTEVGPATDADIREFMGGA